MFRELYKSAFLAIFILASALLIAQDDCIPQAPNPPRLVNDFANVLDNTQEQQMENLLVEFNNATSTQIAVVTVNSLCDYDASMFAYKLGEQWGVGSEKFNNGIVVMLLPKVGNQKGQVFIAPGYGLEGVLPDATTKRIVEIEMIPFFKRNDYPGGVNAALKILMDLTKGEYSADQYNQRNKKRSKPFPLFGFFFILFFVVIMLASTIGRARRYGRRNNMGLWAALWLMGSMNNRHRGYYNNFSSGSGGFGGFGGGGGFGGFGGGSFGGGGAGGSW
ncbi:MAG: hypothetical protein CMO34_06700 [Verrucomicrobia bacterium]|nr:hypothetical protein [Verrucomicrobiota bacterium]